MHANAYLACDPLGDRRQTKNDTSAQQYRCAAEADYSGGSALFQARFVMGGEETKGFLKASEFGGLLLGGVDPGDVVAAVGGGEGLEEGLGGGVPF